MLRVLMLFLVDRCETNEDCLAAREQTSCVKVAEDPELEHNACRHKPVWPLDWRDWVQVKTCRIEQRVFV